MRHDGPTFLVQPALCDQVLTDHHDPPVWTVARTRHRPQPDEPDTLDRSPALVGSLSHWEYAGWERKVLAARSTHRSEKSDTLSMQRGAFWQLGILNWQFAADML